MNILIKALKTLVWFTILFSLITDVAACVTNIDIHDRNEKDLINTNELVLIWKVKENKSIRAWSYDWKWIVKFEVLKSIKWDYKKEFITIEEWHSWKCQFQIFLRSAWIWEVYSLYIPISTPSIEKNKLMYRLDNFWNKKYTSYEEALEDLERIQSTPLFFYKYNEFKEEHFTKKNRYIMLMWIVLLFILFLLKKLKDRRKI